MEKNKKKSGHPAEYFLEYRPDSRVDVKEILASYDSFGSVQGANRIMKKLKDATDNIRIFPYIGKEYYDPELKDWKFHVFPVEKYLIFYRVFDDEKKVVVYRVLNGTTNYIHHLKQINPNKNS